MKKLVRSEPVVLMALVLIGVVVVQKVWLGEIITEDWIEWALGIFGLATGAGVVRKNVYSKHTVEGNPIEMEDHNG